MNTFRTFLLALSFIFVLPTLSLANHHEESTAPVRAAAVVVEAVVVAVDHESRELSLQMPQGSTVTMTAGPQLQRLDEISVGDIVVATYLQSLAADVREPTAEESAEPWVELDAAAIASLDMDPGVAGLRVIRAVCTIEGMNRVARTVMIEDPRGKYHLIGDVDPARLEGITLGTKVIMVYSEAVALTLEKKAN
jgi:hypothetical protein